MIQRTLKRPSLSPDTSQDNYYGNLMADLLNSAPEIHKFHLRVKGVGSYAQHKGVFNFYDSIPDIADSLTERYQGATKTILLIPKGDEVAPIQDKESALSYFDLLYSKVSYAQSICSYSNLINMMDTVKDLIDDARYNLSFLA